MIVLIKRELHSWCFSPVLFAHCILFSLFSLISMFLLSGFIESGESDIGHTFFKWHPWIFAFTAPVIGIRSWSEEHRCGMFEVLGTQPIRMLHVVLAKMAGALFVIVLSLICTLPAIFTVFWLGTPDIGMLFSGYMGSILCGLALVGLSQAICTFMKGSIGAYVCAASLSVILILMGINGIADVILATFPALQWMTNLLSSISILPMYETLYLGRLTLASSLGFFLLIILSITLSTRALLSLRSNQKQYNLSSLKSFTYGIPAFLSIPIFIITAFFINKLPGYIDLTQDNRFSLPQAVADELSSLERPATVRLFSTANHSEFGFDLFRYSQKLKEAMALIEEKSNGNIIFKELDPSINQKAAKMVALEQIKSFSIDNEDPMVFGLVVESLDKKRVFDFLNPNRERYILSDLIQAVLDVTRSNKTQIGLLTPFSKRNDELSLPNWSAIQLLNHRFNVSALNEKDNWSSIDIIVLMQWPEMDQALSNKLSLFIENGGDIITLIDPYSLMYEMFDGADLTLQSATTPNFITERGLRVPANKQVIDGLLRTDMTNANGRESNPAILTLGQEQFNATHSITSGFDYVHFPYVGAIESKAIDGFHNEVLITSSDQALLIPVESTRIGRSAEDNITNNTTSGIFYPLMVLQSNLKNKNAGRLVVISDIDWLHASIAGNVTGDAVLDAGNSNGALLLNLVDFLAGDPVLQGLRTRSVSRRPLNGWSEIREAQSTPYIQPITQASSQIRQLTQQLEKLGAHRNYSDPVANKAIEQEVAQLRIQLKEQRLMLASLRGQREADVKQQLNIIKWGNILFSPIFMLVIGFITIYIRENKIRAGE
uniref:Putative ABC type transport system n=1 Tax=Colwellia sp. An23 TaxID=1719924 RepID=A0A0X8XWC7_9GAMM|nr:putative ABC type transport system [Colwellia sp. An23]